MPPARVIDHAAELEGDRLQCRTQAFVHLPLGSVARSRLDGGLQDRTWTRQAVSCSRG